MRYDARRQRCVDSTAVSCHSLLAARCSCRILRRRRQQLELLQRRGQLKHAAQDGSGAQPRGHRPLAIAVDPHRCRQARPKRAVDVCRQRWGRCGQFGAVRMVGQWRGDAVAGQVRGLMQRDAGSSAAMSGPQGRASISILLAAQASPNSPHLQLTSRQHAPPPLAGIPPGCRPCIN